MVLRKIVFAGLAALILSSCSYVGIGITNIGDIVAKPSRYEGAEVKVKGKVSDVNKLPVVDLRYYTLRDDTGEITVTTQGALPAIDDTVVVKGKVEATAILKGQSLGLRLSEIEKSKF